MLLMLLGGLLDGLDRRATGADRAQRGDLIVFSSTAERLVPAQPHHARDPRRRSRPCPASGRSAGSACAQLGARVRATTRQPRDLVDVALFGYELAPRGVPDAARRPRSLSPTVPRVRRRGAGRHPGARPARIPVKVVGFVDDLEYSGPGPLWASPETWRDVAEREPARRRPSATACSRRWWSGPTAAAAAGAAAPRSTARPTAPPAPSPSTEAVDAIPAAWRSSDRPSTRSSASPS